VFRQTLVLAEPCVLREGMPVKATSWSDRVCYGRVCRLGLHPGRTVWVTGGYAG